ncbi:MAG TPA: hypothetical protein VK518_01690, partial [Puia sp.]|nr:hypothetical protein [Puia sp.]
MKRYQYTLFAALLLLGAAGCKKDFTDTSLVSSASAANLGLLFSITQDNSGLVTIMPSGEGAVSYDMYYGDSVSNFGTVVPGKSISHKYAEGVYTVKSVAHDLKGGTVNYTQQLTVSFKAPENLKLNITQNGVNISVGATALNETYFRISYGDSTAAKPDPSVLFMEGQTLMHTYPGAGTYIITVIAYSGGAETT